MMTTLERGRRPEREVSMTEPDEPPHKLSRQQLRAQARQKHDAAGWIAALDRVSDVDERHESLQRRALVEIALLVGIGVLFVVAVSARSLLGLLWEAIWGNGSSQPAAWALGVAVHALLLVVTFYALYTVVPYGQRDRRSALAGAITATGLFLAVRAGFLAML